MSGYPHMGFDEIFLLLNTFVLLFAKYTIKFKQLVCTLRDRLVPLLVWFRKFIYFLCLPAIFEIIIYVD